MRLLVFSLPPALIWMLNFTLGLSGGLSSAMLSSLSPVLLLTGHLLVSGGAADATIYSSTVPEVRIPDELFCWHKQHLGLPLGADLHYHSEWYSPSLSPIGMLMLSVLSELWLFTEEDPTLHLLSDSHHVLDIKAQLGFWENWALEEKQDFRKGRPLATPCIKKKKNCVD